MIDAEAIAMRMENTRARRAAGRVAERGLGINTADAGASEPTRYSLSEKYLILIALSVYWIIRVLISR